MATTVTQAAAIGITNKLMADIKAFIALLPQIESDVNDYLNNGVGAVLAALPTVALNADGSLGTADATPVEGNIIDPTKVAPHFTLEVSSYNIGLMFNFLQQVIALADGATVTQQATAPAMLSIFTQ
jgi:hypothetical protein